MRWRAWWLVVGLLSSAAWGAPPVRAADEALITFEGACDASGAVFALGGALLVADDRTDDLHSYRPTGGPPVGTTDLYGLTGTPKRARNNFSAFEGVARQGDKIYFVTSHARESHGKNRPNRRRLAAVQSTLIGGVEKIEPVGTAYTKLQADLSESPQLRALGLAGSIMYLHRQLPHLAPDKQGLNIEGLAAGPDGSLLIGLRNPRPQGKAIVIPLLNPDRVVLGLASPQFGPPSRLDLGGLGIAAMAWSPQEALYYVVAARHDRPGNTKLYRWSGGTADPAVFVQDILPADFEAQGLAITADGKRLMVVSDDGDRSVAVESADQCRRPTRPDGTCPCGFVADPARQRFRGRWIDLTPVRVSAKP